MNDHIRIPPKANAVLRTLCDAGYEAYVVGGCVRDSCLHREPEDWDITTSALPGEVKRLFPKTVDTGIAHGTVTVRMGGEAFEVTTYRIDGDYTDSRHPSRVTFTGSLAEDLRRRDFTVNAMAYNEKAGLIDLFSGIEDMKRRVIRCVGEPEERFEEDALRMMRAVRFAAQLDYTIETRTASAIRRQAASLRKISAERVRTELEKLLVSLHPEYLRNAYELGITAVILPEFDACMATPQNNPYHLYTVGEHTLRALQNIRADRILRLTMLFHDIAKPLVVTTDENGTDHFFGHARRSAELTKKILRRLKYDNRTIARVCNLVAYHDAGVGREFDAAALRRMICRVGREDFPLLFEVIAADQAAKSDRGREENTERLAKAEALYERILADGDPLSAAELAVHGADLKEAGMQPGKIMGRVLAQMLDEVLREPACNTKEYLLAPERLEAYIRQAEAAESKA